jgi:DnaJ-class molecular chaperone
VNPAEDQGVEGAECEACFGTGKVMQVTESDEHGPVAWSSTDEWCADCDGTGWDAA